MEPIDPVSARQFPGSVGHPQAVLVAARPHALGQLGPLRHDWDKGYDDPGILARADELGLDLPEELRASAM